MSSWQAIVSAVETGSIAAELGIESGDQITNINGNPVRDLIDISFAVADEYLELEIHKRNGEDWTLEIEKEYDEDLGISFESAVFDGVIPCHNKCVFCFVDQMPKGMRSTLYVKDDDYRLSFLYGNFITLTNLSAQDLQRIIQYHLSPIYVSVHAIDPETRYKLVKNPRSKNIKTDLKKLINSGIELHTQIVLCPGLNDGKILDQTIDELAAFSPGVLSIAIVPVGLTRYREKDDPITCFNSTTASEIIGQVEAWQQLFRNRYGKTLVYLADEFYLLANHIIPETKHYDDFPQLENGIGIVRLFLDEWNEAVQDLPNGISGERNVTIICGTSAAKVFTPLVSQLKIENLHVQVLPVENDFFGHQVTVTGLLTGQDISAAIKNSAVGDTIILPSIALRKGENIFLDNKTPEFIANETGKILKFASNAQELISAILE